MTISGTTARPLPTAPIQIASWTPMVVAMIPPRIWPTGIVPQTTNRIVAFIRPCIAAGVMACRKLTWLML